MQRDELMSQVLDWATRAENYTNTAAQIHLELARALTHLNAQASPQVGDRVVLRLDLHRQDPPRHPITGIVQAWPELGLDDLGYLVLVEPFRHQICTTGDFLVTQQQQ